MTAGRGKKRERVRERGKAGKNGGEEEEEAVEEGREDE